MNTLTRPGLMLTIVIAGLCGCAAVTAPIERVAARIAHPFTPSSPSVPSPAGLDDYKTLVARQVADRNPEHRYAGTLPPLLPAIVVLEITVDENGRMTNVVVQRSRDAAASRVALASMRRSEPLPRPERLARAGRLTFSETFLFADRERYQLRSLASGQASE